MAGVVGMACENCKRPVDLFSEHEARESMRESEGAEGEEQGCAFARFVGPSVGRTDGKDDLLSAVIALAAEPFCERFGGHLSSAGVEEDFDCRCAALLAIEPVKEGVFGAK